MNMNINVLGKMAYAIIAFALVACGQGNVVETPSGLEVEMIRTSADAEAFELGDVLELHLKYGIKGGSTLFDTDERGGPVKLQITDQDRGLFNEMINVLKVGDSAHCQIEIDDLYLKTYARPIPDSIATGTLLDFQVGIISAMSLEERVEEQKNKDIVIIDEYLNANQIVAEKHDSGLRYVVTENGGGEKPNLGDSLFVSYTGKFLENGEIFDSSETFTFVLGRGVIQGWSTGFGLLSKGDKATLYIPSTMAYGERGYPRAIPPNAILVFDVELVDLKRN